MRYMKFSTKQHAVDAFAAISMGRCKMLKKDNRLAYVAFAPAILLLLAMRDEEIVGIKANDSRGKIKQTICDLRSP